MSSFQSNQQITAQQFMDNLVTLYNDYWNDPAGVFDFNDGNHTTDLTRRKGWGQEQVKVKGITETLVTTGLLIEAEHLNTVIAQVNAGLQHIDNNNLLMSSVLQDTVITAQHVEPVRQTIVSTIDNQKFACNDDLDISLIESSVSNNGTAWSEDLYSEHVFTFNDYNHARHFFNSGGQITTQLDMTNTNSSYSLIWDQIFDSFGWVGIAATNTFASQDQNLNTHAQNLVPNRGFYSLTNDYTTLFESVGAVQTGNAYAYAYAYSPSAYNNRRVRIEGKADDSNPNSFTITLRVSLIEDMDDNWEITGEIVASHGFLVADLSPDSSTLNMNPYTGIPGTTQYRFQPITPPTVTLLTGWTSFNI